MTVDVEIESRIAKCQKILGTDPNSQIFAALADAHRKRGELETAFGVCQNGLRIHPDYGAAHVVMAKINLDRGLYDWAEAEVKKARELDGNNRAIELLLAEIYIYRGEYKDAVQLLKKLCTSDPENRSARRLLEIAQKIPQEQAKEVGPPVSEAEPKVAPTVETVETPVAPIREPLKLSELLCEALAIEHVLGSLYMNDEGLVIEAEWQLDVDQATCGAALAEVRQFLNQELMKVSFGQIGSVLIETATKVFYLVQVANGLFLIVGDSELNLGNLRMKMADLLQRSQVI